MDITPAPAFMEAVRQVPGIDNLVLGPEVVIPAIRDSIVGSKIKARHEEVVCSGARQFADESVAEMKRDGCFNGPHRHRVESRIQQA